MGKGKGQELHSSSFVIHCFCQWFVQNLESCVVLCGAAWCCVVLRGAAWCSYSV
jgi:hypothetical protein